MNNKRHRLSKTVQPRCIGNVLALMSTALAWSVSTSLWAGSLEGTAAYRERIALPPGAVFEALLQDVSRADAPAQVLGRATIDPAGQPPFRFRIAYDDAAIQAGRRYAVRATVKHQGRLLFTTDQVYPVFEDSTAPLELLLVSARGRSPSAESGSEEDGNPPADRPLHGTHWKLTHLGETPVEVTENQTAPHLVLADDTQRVSGSGGCNRVMGGFQLDGDKLRFGQMASTMMACVAGMEQEQQFLHVLKEVEGYRIQGNHLEMLDAAGTVVARFEAVTPH